MLYMTFKVETNPRPASQLSAYFCLWEHLLGELSLKWEMREDRCMPGIKA